MDIITKNYRRFLCAIFVVVVLCTGCATKIPFTHQLREKYNLTPQKLKNIQYYVSAPITLQRELAKEETSLDKHGLRIVDKGKVEEIRIKRGTPCIAKEIGEYWIKVSFESDNTLMFGSLVKDSDVWGGRYNLVAEDAKGKMTYNDKTFYAIDRSWSAYLQIKFKSLKSELKKKSKKIKGRQLK